MAKPVTAPMAVQCVELLGLTPITESKVHMWAHRDKVRRLGRDQFGLQQYDLDDIIKLVAAGAEAEVPAAA